MRKAVWVLVVLLAILHFDFWYWDDRTLVFGFLPIGLAFHAGFSVACGIVWFMAVKYAWPAEIEEWASAGDPPPPPSEGGELPVHEAAGRAADPFATDEEGTL